MGLNRGRKEEAREESAITLEGLLWDLLCTVVLRRISEVNC